MPALTMSDLKSQRVPPCSIAIWWLGQASFIIKSPAGKIAAIDPYLTNSCKAFGDNYGCNFDRLHPAPITPEELAGIDLYVLTHTHQDHLDPETLNAYRAAGGKGHYIAPGETAEKLRTLGVPAEQITTVWPNKTHTIGDLTLRTTFAIPYGGDDLTHVGYLVFIEGGPTVYFTGDTAYEDILHLAVKPHKPDVLVSVINGGFRNLGPNEAAKLARLLDVKVVIPCHYDLFLDNSVPPQLLRTNLLSEGIGDRYRVLEHGKVWIYPQ